MMFLKQATTEIDIMLYFCTSNQWDFCEHFTVPLLRAGHVIVCLASFEETISLACFSCPLCVVPARNPLNLVRFYFTPIFLSPWKPFSTDENFKFRI